MLTRIAKIAKHTGLTVEDLWCHRINCPGRSGRGRWASSEIVWMNFRVHELFWGIFAGSLAAAAAPAARAIFVRPWTVIYTTIAATMVEAVTVGRAHPPRP
jgi:hypothetical protein